MGDGADVAREAKRKSGFGTRPRPRPDRPEGEPSVTPDARAAGNLAVQRLSRSGSSVATGLRHPPTAAPTVADQPGPVDLGLGEPEPPLARIREINRERWVGPGDEAELEELWPRLGLPYAARRYEHDWWMSFDGGMEPGNLPGGEGIANEYRLDAVILVHQFLEGNRADVAEEMRRLGIFEGRAPEAGAVPRPEHDANLYELRSLAERVKVLKNASDAFRTITVGYTSADLGKVLGPDFATGRVWIPVRFEPGQRPERGLEGAENLYQDVMAQYQQVTAAMMAIADQHPAVYLALRQDQLDRIIGDPTAARQDEPGPLEAIKTLLTDALAQIDETRERFETGDLDVEELDLIHLQLQEGQKRPREYDWAHPYYRAFAKEVVEDYDTSETIIDLALGLASAVAFIFAGLSTGGLATAFFVGGLGVSGASVARKWENYANLRTASEAGTSSQTELVSEGKVRAAAVDAVLESAFFFLDAIGVARAGIKGAEALQIKGLGKEAAEAAAGTSALRRLDELPADQAARDVERAVNQLGVNGAAAAANREPEALLKFVEEHSPTAARIKAFLAVAAEGLAPVDLHAALKTAVEGGKVAGRTGAPVTLERIAAQAIDELGFMGALRAAGGWKKLASALGPESEAGRRLKAWRDAIYNDLESYVEGLRVADDDVGRLFQETGSKTNVTNDLDMSFLGPRASQNKTRAAQYLAGRTGLPAAPAYLDKMLYIGLFTDPRRMHLFDEFPALQVVLQRTVASFEERLIRSDEYVRWLRKDPVVADTVLTSMRSLGVEPIRGFRPLSETAVDVLSAEADRVHAAINAAKRGSPPDLQRLRTLVTELATIQAQINVKEGGGYFTAGGVRRFVTERENFPGTWQPVTRAHDYQAALDQVSKLRDTVYQFEKETLLLVPGVGAVALLKPNAADLAAAIKSLSKYGHRFAGVAKQGRPEFDTLAERFQKIFDAAQVETGDTLQARLAKDAGEVIRQTREAMALYDALHIDILRKLREAAALPGAPDLTDAILTATRNRYMWLRFESMLVYQMGTVARAAGIAIGDDGGDFEPEPSRAGTDASWSRPTRSGVAGFGKNPHAL